MKSVLVLVFEFQGKVWNKQCHTHFTPIRISRLYNCWVLWNIPFHTLLYRQIEPPWFAMNTNNINKNISICSSSLNCYSWIQCKTIDLLRMLSRNIIDCATYIYDTMRGKVAPFHAPLFFCFCAANVIMEDERQLCLLCSPDCAWTPPYNTTIHSSLPWSYHWFSIFRWNIVSNDYSISFWKQRKKWALLSWNDNIEYTCNS